MNLFALLDQAASRFADRGAVYRGERVLATWGELRDRALRLATSVRQLGGPGARIAIASENRPEIVELMFAIWAAECVVVPINYKLHPREMAQILDDAGVSQVFASPKIAPELAGVSGAAIETLGTESYSRWFAAAPSTPPSTDPSTLAWLFYTSGTTGRSKGAMLSHRNLMAMTLSHLADFDSPDENCSLVHGAPMSHGSGLYIPPYVLRGARQVIPESGAFEPDEFLDLCEHHPGCSAFLAPTMVQRLVQTGRPCPRNLRTVVYGGGPMYVDSLKKAMAAFGPIFTQLYGQGEAPMTITGLAPGRPSDRRRRDPGLGRLRPIRGGRRGAPRRRHTRRNRRDRRNRLPRRRCDVGLLEQSRGHRGHTAERLAAHRRHGLLRRARLSHPARPIEGRGHQRRQQHLPARSGGGADRAPSVSRRRRWWVHRTPSGARSSSHSSSATVDPADLDAHLLERIARFKRPKRYEFVDELPKNSYGKVLKRELRNQLT